MMFCGCIDHHRSKTRFDFDFHSLDSNSLDNWMDIVKKILDLLFKENLIVIPENINIFLVEIYNYYEEQLSFHNHRHAIEVFQLGVCFLLKMKHVISFISKKDIFTYCVALLTHDIGHRGYTNEELRNQDKSEINSVFPNSCRVSIEPDYSYLNSESFNEITHAILGNHLLRKHNIDYNKDLYNKLIYYTDLSRHTEFKSEHNLKTNFRRDAKTRDSMLILFIKLADIGHVLRPWDEHCKFVVGLNKERKIMHPTEDLSWDTVCFNEMFVKDLILLFKDLNECLSRSLLKRYESNIQKWKDIMLFTELSKKIELSDSN